MTVLANTDDILTFLNLFPVTILQRRYRKNKKV